MSDKFKCPYCGKDTFKANFGLTNHMKTCDKKPKVVDNSDDPRDQDPRYRKVKNLPHQLVASRDQIGRESPAASRTIPFEAGGGAFYMFPDYILTMIELNFAAALGEHILTNGSSNKAVLAFGHQCKKISDLE